MLGKRGSLGGFQLGSRNLLELKVRQTFEVDAACTVEGQDDLDVGEEALGLIVDAEPQRGPRHTGEVPPAGRPTGLQPSRYRATFASICSSLKGSGGFGFSPMPIR